MQAHRIETTIQPGGALAVQGLPFPEGARVEIIVLAKDELVRSAHSLRRAPYWYDQPFEAAPPAVEREAET